VTASSKRSSTIGAGGGGATNRRRKAIGGTWLLLAGRGFGKTRSGAECIRDQVIDHRRRRIALVAPTAADARDVMVGRPELLV
jgi:phage terminase large subunit-like protein